MVIIRMLEGKFPSSKVLVTLTFGLPTSDMVTSAMLRSR